MDGARLLELQSLDTAIERLESRRESLIAGTQIASLRTAADRDEALLGELRLRIAAIDRDAARLDHEVDTMRQKLAAEERRLFDGSVANPKELASIQHEVDNIKRRIEDREDEELAMLEAREAAAAGSELTDVEQQLRQRRAERDRLAPAIDPEVLELYEDLRRQKKGVGAAALVDGVCQGCHEQLSAMELDRLRRNEGVPRCEHCRRILVA